MKLVDANVLLYAINEDAERHDVCVEWLGRSLAGAAPIGFAWNVIVAFLRVSTLRSVFRESLSTTEAVECVAEWLDRPAAHVLHPTSRHLILVEGLLATAGAGGNLVNDAHLAALAIEHKAQVVTFDRDFGRFPGVRWELPE